MKTAKIIYRISTILLTLMTVMALISMHNDPVASQAAVDHMQLAPWINNLLSRDPIALLLILIP
jgi:hypothetical protein